MSSSTVIVFGPTGNIGAYASRFAHSQGAKVILAMRDPSKTISGLPESEEKAGNYQRVKADLTDPESLKKAVQETGATRAYMYLVWTMQDHMRSSLEALKSAGIEFLVFLSSFTIGSSGHGGDAKNVPQDDLIPYAHAQVELQLDQVFGKDHYIAIRPGNFATNLLARKGEINKGEVRIYGGDFMMDGITPRSMGEVSGAILAKGSPNMAQTGGDGIYCFGPEAMSIEEGIQRVAKALGKEIKITKIDAEEGRKQMVDHGMPPPMADYMMKRFSEEQDESVERPKFKDGVENIKKYTGRPSMTLEEFVAENKEMWVS